MSFSLKRRRSPSPLYYGERPGPSGHASLSRLEALEAELCPNELLASQVEGTSQDVHGGRLIRLAEDDFRQAKRKQLDGVWVDRYDARLLLSPRPCSTFHQPCIVSPPPLSPTGYSDLPSDHEEMFYFDLDERQEIAQKKLRRKRDDERYLRVKLREEEDRQREAELKLSRIPPPEQINLMSRTLQALKSSPAPSLLEIRILTNHGSDPRFSSFLRKDGKWWDYWESMKSGESETQDIKELPSRPAPQPVGRSSNGLCRLADYGDSSDDGHESGSDKSHTANSSYEQEHIKGRNNLENDAHENSLPGPSNSDSFHPSGLGESSPQVNFSQRRDQQDLVNSELEALHVLLDDHQTTKVEPAEQLKRQERARQWAERRRKLASGVCPPES